MTTLWIKFEGFVPKMPLAAETDEAIVAAKKVAETILGKPLPVDQRTGFPSFTIYGGKGGKKELGGG